jgi:hypothetical protein
MQTSCQMEVNCKINNCLQMVTSTLITYELPDGHYHTGVIGAYRRQSTLSWRLPHWDKSNRAYVETTRGAPFSKSITNLTLTPPYTPFLHFLLRASGVVHPGLSVLSFLYPQVRALSPR